MGIINKKPHKITIETYDKSYEEFENLWAY